jgi:DsbC/DsbD-like thiol-disulfide interchange protein
MHRNQLLILWYRFLLALVFSVFVGCAAPTHQSPSKPEFALPEFAPGQKIVAAVGLDRQKIGASETAALYLNVRTAPGHHIYAMDQSGSSTRPTAIEVSLPEGLTLAEAWQAPKAQVQSGAGIYQGEFQFVNRLVATGLIRPGHYKIPVKLTFQICNEALCWPPESLTREVELEITKP